MQYATVDAIQRADLVAFHKRYYFPANTMLAGEVAAGYRAWADPGNVRDPAIGILNDATSFGNPAGPSHCTILMVDGSVRTISKNVSPAVLKAIATPSGGEQVPAF